MADDPRQPVFRSNSPRVALNEHAKLLIDKKHAYDVVITDTSQEGFRIRSDRVLLMTPTPATLRVHRYGDFDVEIRWARGYEAGGIFLDAPPQLS